MEKEEGEMSDDNAMILDEDQKPDLMDSSSVLVYEPNKDGLLIHKLGKTDVSKLEERAKRFGLDLTGRKTITQKQIDELYENFGVNNGDERHYRLDTIHLGGVGGLSTKDIFEYLQDYKPVSLEWVNDTSCNVICQDHITAALALLVHSREITNSELKHLIVSTSAHHWREGFPHPKKEMILFRFATKSDKKDSAQSPVDDDSKMFENLSKNPWGDLCMSWGIYDHQEILNRHPIRRFEIYDTDEDEEEHEEIVPKNKGLAKRLGKRGQDIDNAQDSDSDREWQRKSKVPRMRMHADDEEIHNKKKTLKIVASIAKESIDYASLSIEIVNSHDRQTHPASGSTVLSEKFKKHAKLQVNSKDSVHSRLGPRLGSKEVVRSKNSQKDSESSLSDEDSEHNVMSRVHKVSSTRQQTKTNSNIWSRLSKNIEDKSRNDLRETLKDKKSRNREDLRKKLGSSRSGRSPLRIEVDNEYYDSD